MNLFDLHCDTAGECYNRKIPLLSNDLHVSLSKGDMFDKWSQLFAVWIPDEIRGEKAKKYFCNVYSNFKKELSYNTEKIKLCKSFDDYQAAISSSKCAAFLTVEGASALCSSKMMDYAQQIGVKLVTLTWNADNEIAGGCQSNTDLGFTEFGKHFIKELEKANIIADVSHINRKSFFELMDMETDVPVIASHSNSASVLLKTRIDSKDRWFSERRLLTDEQIKLLIERKSLIGLNFCNSFLGDPGDDGFSAVLRHAEHILSLGGEDSICIGSDFDGCEMNPELSGLDKMFDLYCFLSKSGLENSILDKMFYKNAENFFISVLQKG